MSDTQFFCDQIDQMDLALDQLALKDRNFDRFALMLIDNVVELALHRHAEHQNQMVRTARFKIDPAILAAGMGQRIDAKLKLAKLTGWLSEELATSFGYLHAFRNTAYHRGLRHEGILHSIALFYFQSACSALANWRSSWWSHGDDVIPHRALKYVGRSAAGQPESFRRAWERLADVASAMGNALVFDLTQDMRKTVDALDDAIDFLATDSPNPKTRARVVIDVQAWAIIWTEKAIAFAKSKRVAPAKHTVGSYFEWLVTNYPWPLKIDPVPNWRRRLASLADERLRQSVDRSDFAEESGPHAIVVS